MCITSVSICELISFNASFRDLMTLCDIFETNSYVRLSTNFDYFLVDTGQPLRDR